MANNLTNETPPDAAPAGEAEVRGISPAVVLLLVSGLVGLVTGTLMLLSELSGTGENSTAPPDRDSLLAPREINDWEAPPITLVGLDGEPVDLADYRGQPVFVNFWATWCPPCVAEMPDLQAFMREADRHGAVVLAVNVAEERDDIAAFLDDIGVTDLPILLDTDSLAFRAYNVGQMPTTFVIDAEGMVRYLKVGQVGVADLYNFLDLIDWQQPAQG